VRHATTTGSRGCPARRDRRLSARGARRALVFVAGTTATSPEGGALHAGDAGKQTEVIPERIDAALRQLGSRLEDVVETRIYVTDMAQWPAVGRAHGAVFKDIRPASTLVEVGALIYPYLLVEIPAIAATD
jgi:enamine deaminase RidA (YjgF/YER057c/UK114 family)